MQWIHLKLTSEGCEPCVESAGSLDSRKGHSAHGRSKDAWLNSSSSMGLMISNPSMLDSVTGSTSMARVLLSAAAPSRIERRNIVKVELKWKMA